jgi:hypothetical protein
MRVLTRVEIDRNTEGHKGLPEHNNPTSCVLVYYDLLSFGPLVSLLLYPGGVGLQGRSKLVTLMIPIQTLSLLT